MGEAMKILVISDQKKMEEYFSGLIKNDKTGIQFFPREGYRTRLKNLQTPLLVYFDILQLSQKDFLKELRYLGKIPGVLTAVIDARGGVDDPAALFHEGAVDYLGKKQLLEGIGLKRIKTVCGFHKEPVSPPEKPLHLHFEEKYQYNKAILVPGSDWKEVREGKEYIFGFLFAELDLPGDWKKKSGQVHLKKVKDAFHEYIRKAVEQNNGRIWMWNEFGGLVLFPYEDGPSQMVLTAAKLMLHRTIASCEDFQFKTAISYRLALHIGSTIYKNRGKTGTIVAEAVNFTFHLGNKFARPGNMYITKPVYELTHSGLKDLFVREEIFEGREIFRMKNTL